MIFISTYRYSIALCYCLFGMGWSWWWCWQQIVHEAGDRDDVEPIMFSLIIPTRRRPCLDMTLHGAGFLPKKCAAQQKLLFAKTCADQQMVANIRGGTKPSICECCCLVIASPPHVQLHGFALMRVSRRNPHHVDPLLPSLRQRLQHQSRSIR